MTNRSLSDNDIEKIIKKQQTSYYIEKEYKAVRKQARRNKEIKRKFFS
jgi:hypothetical protein